MKFFVIHGIQGSSFHGILNTFSKEFHGKWIFMEIDGHISVEFHGNHKRHFHGIPWKCMERFPWNFMECFHGIPWKLCPNPPWNSMEFFPMEMHGQISLVFHGNFPWNSMEDFPWNSMEFHDGGISHGLVQIMYNNAY